MSLKTLVIAGRPNVGKSTLFNRLAGRRLALVDPTPGLTRDRREAEIDIAGAGFRLIDTAGLEEAEAGSLAERMRRQSETAISGADLVLLVIDARAGLTSDDRMIAETVRRSGRPVLLVANKCEGRAGTDGFYESFSLGLGEPVAISAEHGEGISDLQQEILAKLAAGPEEQKGDASRPEDEFDGAGEEPSDGPHRLRLAIVGRPNAGKSTLVNSILGEERMITGPEAGITRDTIGIDLDYRGRELRLFDTAGLRRKARIEERAEQLAASDTLRAIRFAEVVVLLVDAEHPFEQQDLRIAELVADEGRALVVGINKWDLVEDRQARLKQLREDAERLLPQVKDVPLVPVSALSGSGVDKLMKAVLAVYEAWNRRIPTPQLNRWLAEAVERHAPPSPGGRRIRLRFMTQPSTRPPTFVVFCSRPEALPQSYVRYLVNGLREVFEVPAVPIRLHLRKGENPYAK